MKPPGEYDLPGGSLPPALLGEHGCYLLLAPFPPVSSTEQAQKLPECSSLATPGTKPSLVFGLGFGFGLCVGLFCFGVGFFIICLVIQGSFHPPPERSVPGSHSQSGVWDVGAWGH